MMPRLYIEVDEKLKDEALATPHDDDESNASLYRRIFIAGIQALEKSDGSGVGVIAQPLQGQFTGLYYP